MAKKEIVFLRLAQYIELCDFPCNKEELLLTATECQFPDDVMNVCEDMPNRIYESEEDVMNEVDQDVGYFRSQKDARLRGVILIKR